jgi:hypothetical protein
MTVTTLIAPSHHVILTWLLLLAAIACQAFAAEEPVCKESSSENCANPDASSSSSAWWEQDDWTFPDLWGHFECPQHYIQPRPAYNPEVWKTLRQSYIDFVGKEKSTIIIQGDDGDDDGFFVDVRVRQSPGKGRGVFAAHGIQKGQHIWTGTKNMALLNNAEDYKRFLAFIPTDTACDILHDLGYVHIPDEDKSDPSGARITLLLDDFAFVNVYDDPPGDIGCLEEHQDLHVGGCELNFYALRDIHEGEEILMDATHLHAEPFGWEWFGLDDHVDWWEIDGWDIPDLLAHFQCQGTSPRPIYTQAIWMKLRQIYHDTVGSDRSSIGTPISEKDGFDVEIEVKRTKDKGRSLFAAQDIQKGELIWAGTRQTALFDNAKEYKQFLALVPPDIACDQLRGLAYVLRADKDDDQANWRIAVELDDCAFANTIIHDDETPDTGCLPEWKDRYPGGCKLNYFALQDIKKGQEILVDYDQFDIPDGWEYFGLGTTLFFEVEERPQDEIWEQEEYFLPDLWNHFECDNHYESPGPLYSQKTWMNLRQVYHEVVGTTKSSIGYPVLEEDGFSVTVQAKQSESDGRSLIATQDIKKGEHIWTGLKQKALFDNDVDFKKFLDRIPVHIACDHLDHLGFVQIFGEDNDSMEDARIVAILDDCAFGAVVELPREDAAADADPVNAGCLPEWKDRYPGGCDQNVFALKDIRAGQDIVQEDTDLFDTLDGWDWFDMGPFLAHELDVVEQMRQEDRPLFNPWSHYNCDVASVWPSPRPIYSQEMWMRLRQAYVDSVGSTKSSIGTEASAEDGFEMSTQVKQAPGKGRGLFAAEDISIGQLIWSSLKQTASFHSGEDFANFLDALEVDEACDVIQWSYVYAIPGGPDEGATQIATDLDDMTFVNSVMDADADAGCLSEWEARHPGGCLMNYYALRDIKKGEEILVDYGEFAISDGWSTFGLV